MKVQEAATGKLATVWENESLKVAAQRLVEEEVGALVVFGSRGARGIISERDIVRAIHDDVDLEAVEVDEYMTEAPVSISQDSTMRRAVEKMDEYSIRHLVVLEDGDPVGVLSVRDVLHAMETRHRYP
jgi:CBS domain-containing protein